MKLNWNLQRGRGSLGKKHLSWGMDIFWNYTTLKHWWG